MPIRNQETLIEYFSKGRRPTSGHYEDLIDSIFGAINDIVPEASYGATLFVDNGTSVTQGMRGAVNLPYSSIGDALADAQFGDLIMIFPSNNSYPVTNLFVPGIRYFALPGVEISSDTSQGPPTEIFNSEEMSSGTVHFDGYARFPFTGARFANITAGNRLRLKANRIEISVSPLEGTEPEDTINAPIRNEGTLLLEADYINYASASNGIPFIFNSNFNATLHVTNLILNGSSGLNTNAIVGNGRVQIVGNFLTNMLPSSEVNFLSGEYEVTNSLIDPNLDF